MSGYNLCTLILTLSTRKVPLLDKGGTLTFLVPDTLSYSCSGIVSNVQFFWLTVSCSASSFKSKFWMYNLVHLLLKNSLAFLFVLVAIKIFMNQFFEGWRKLLISVSCFKFFMNLMNEERNLNKHSAQNIYLV